MGNRLDVGDIVPVRELTTLQGESVPVPDPHRLLHLQFRRYAACPICNLHLRSVARRHDEIVAAGIREVVVFHSTVEQMLPYQGELPFAAVADPRRRLYAAFAVGTSPRAMLHPRVLVAAVRAALAGMASSPARGDTALGLPADFLIAPDGRIVAGSYGRHADDQWTVDELLSHARPVR